MDHHFWYSSDFSIIEGTKEALERLGLDYVDVIFAHRPDPTGKLSHSPQPMLVLMRLTSLVPMEEVVRAFNFVIEKGWVSRFSRSRVDAGILTVAQQAFYWATSEWSAREIEEAHGAEHPY